METGPEAQFQQLKPSEKAKFIRVKLAEFGTDMTDRSLGELNVTFLHPEVLTWAGVKPVRLPPQQGKIIDLSPDINHGRKNKLKFLRVDLTGTAYLTGISYAQFGLGAVEITNQGEIFIDCTKLDTPKGPGQAIFAQNTFIEKH